MAHTLFSHHWHCTQNTLIQQQVDAAIAAENQPLPEQLPNYTRIVHMARVNGDFIWSWYPPRYITPPEYICDLEHEEFLYRHVPVLLDTEEQQDETPVLQEAEQQEPILVLQVAEPLEHIVVQINYPRQFQRIVHHIIYIFLAILVL